ncbi:NAD(P)-binding Rossmann-like domain containing protein, putative [Trypanosoma equiperdum]|uniref:NAD(P)-binding Rossmann-like domain containing protein, putative n=1 Tax=Trypanosoma equiperdum TaxID=5694 RepID=A0A1G4IKL5_TRYEQ|nr:NAD(P)-binding Rossmann-like domain containing protein, putative [Trypanosoma equiperdum]
MLLVALFIAAVVVIIVHHCATTLFPHIQKMCDARHNRVTCTEVDYIVIGAGPGGIAAAQHLLQHDPQGRVLIVERGEDPSPGGVFASLHNFFQPYDLLCHTLDLVGSRFGELFYIRHPLRRCSSASCSICDDASISVSPRLSNFVEHRRGCGLGGTSIIDWAMYFPSIPVEPAARNHAGFEDLQAVPHRLARGRNPLSWAFAEAAAVVTDRRGSPAGAESSVDRKCGDQPSLLRIDGNGRRIFLFNHMLKNEGGRLTVLSGTEVVGMTTSDDGEAIVCVKCKPKDQEPFTVSLRRGVILSGGTFGTPNLLKGVLSKPPGPYLSRDSIAVPLIFQALPGLSDDRVNIHSFVAHTGLWFGGRGPLLNPFCDTLATIDVPSLGPRAKLVIFLLPFGGRDSLAYGRLGFNYVFGAFREGFTMLITLSGVEDIRFDVSDTQKEGATEGSNAHFSVIDEKMRHKVSNAFIDGMEFCRQVVAEAPLRYLTTGCEAADVMLFRDAVQMKEYVRVLCPSRRKLTEGQRAHARGVLLWVKEMVSRQDYMEEYVRRHAMWLGFASGGCEQVLPADGGLRVACMRNLFIGDCTAVTDAMWRAGGCDTLRAGSVSTAVAVGKAAAAELLSI